MKGRLIAFVALAAGLMVFCGPVVAHHGSQGYDFTKRITLKGTVSRFVWANPHCQIYLDSKDGNGKVTNWGADWNNPGNLVAWGWTHLRRKEREDVTSAFNPVKHEKPSRILLT